jgi:hypothetical protein
VRRVFHLLAFSLFASCLADIVALGGSEVTLDDVISRNTQAMGGAAGIENVRVVEIRLHITDSGHSEVDAIYYAGRPGRMRIDIIANGKRIYVERYDGRKGLEWEEGEGEHEEAAVPTAALRQPGNLFGPHETQQRGHRLELKGWDATTSCRGLSLSR